METGFTGIIANSAENKRKFLYGAVHLVTTYFVQFFCFFKKNLFLISSWESVPFNERNKSSRQNFNWKKTEQDILLLIKTTSCQFGMWKKTSFCANCLPWSQMGIHTLPQIQENPHDLNPQIRWFSVQNFYFGSYVSSKVSCVSFIYLFWAARRQ